MKKQSFWTGIFSILLIFGMFLAGCDTGTGGGGSSGGDSSDDEKKTPTTGSITVKNNSSTYKIAKVDIFDVVTDQSIKIDSDGIDKDKSKTYDTEPNDKLQVWVEDDQGKTYKSTQFALKAGDSKTFAYDGNGIYAQ
ncbi:MAG: hypothetical protein LBL64_09310 [Treponema sp.]|jgi:hypothetical protein|nr:hypothetical protein [Treponema sp.]